MDLPQVRTFFMQNKEGDSIVKVWPKGSSAQSQDFYLIV